jgi:ER-bound oxygenase mpaB/B'/Rubber oxygenase, catalytic domain
MYMRWQTYGIPSISSLLIATGQISTDSPAGTKRMADTGALLLEAVLNPPASDRAIAAIARINYIHDRHRQRGRISDADMLYTLSLFALEPSRWVRRLEWREMTDLELCALGVLWKSIGEAMEIPFDVLPSSRSGWRNGLEWLDELSEWSSVYEQAHMVPATSNKRLAESTIDRMLWKLPVGMKAVGRNVAAALLEDKLREAML